MAGAPNPDTETIHATAVAVGERAVLLTGPSGSGKSDLALRCILTPPTSFLTASASLVADDRVVLRKSGGNLYASPPEQICGLLEVRGLGLYRLPYSSDCPVTLIAELTAPDQIERLPRTTETTQLLGLAVPRIHIAPFEAAAAQKILLAMSDLPRMDV